MFVVVSAKKINIMRIVWNNITTWKPPVIFCLRQFKLNYIIYIHMHILTYCTYKGLIKPSQTHSNVHTY